VIRALAALAFVVACGRGPAQCPVNSIVNGGDQPTPKTCRRSP